MNRSDTKYRNFGWLSSACCLPLLLLLLVIGTSCQSAAQKEALTQQLEQIKQENEQLKSNLAEKEQQLEQLNGQMQTLQGFPADRMQYFTSVDSIEFGRYTRAYDDNKDAKDDGVAVYLIPKDQFHDVIKASGDVTVELWELEAEENSRQIHRWEFPLAELSNYWLSGPLTYHYKFQLPWPPGYAPHPANLTLKLTFQDAFTGRRFEIQKLLPAR
jgi:cell division protein FtsB